MPKIDPAREVRIGPEPDPNATIITIDSDEENDAKCDDVNPSVPPEALSNPPPYHKLSAKQYNSLANIKLNLREFTALANFYIVKVRSTNHLDGFGPTYVNFAY